MVVAGPVGDQEDDLDHRIEGVRPEMGGGVEHQLVDPGVGHLGEVGDPTVGIGRPSGDALPPAVDERLEVDRNPRRRRPGGGVEDVGGDGGYRVRSRRGLPVSDRTAACSLQLAGAPRTGPGVWCLASGICPSAYLHEPSQPEIGDLGLFGGGNA